MAGYSSLRAKILNGAVIDERIILKRLVIPIIPVILAAVISAAPTLADDHPPLPPDTVQLSLSAEGWVEAEAARVRIAVDSALSGGEVGDLRVKLKDTLAKLVPNADWYITALDRSRDQAGLERWHLEAEARAPETALDGLYDRAKSASKPGEQITVSDIDFTPSMAEREAVMADLRAKIYAAAKDELAKLAQVYPDRNYRLRMFDFGPQGPMPMMKMARAPAPGMMASVAESASSPSPIGVAEHVELSANVVLAADPPKPKSE